MVISRWLTRHLAYPLALRFTDQQAVPARTAALRRQQRAPWEQLHERRTEALRRLVMHAIDSVPHYATVLGHLRRTDVAGMSAQELWGIHAEFPVVTKSQIQADPQRFVSTQPMGRLGTKITGGSTGQPVTIKKPAAALAQERAAMWLAYGWFGVEIGDRCLRFWGIPQNRRRRLFARLGDVAMNRRTFTAFSFDEEDLRVCWRRFRSHPPDYVHGYVSLIEEFARLGLQEDLVSRARAPKSVVVTAETLSSSQRESIETALRAPVQVEYGCGELGPIAHECPEGGLHLHAPNVELQLVDDQFDVSPSGRVIVTDLHNLSMPLIRYDLGDYATWGADCTCGRTYPTLSGVFGRAYDTVEDPSGRRYHGEFFLYLFEDLRDQGCPVSQFQVRQLAPSELTVRVVCDPDDALNTLSEVRELLSRHLPQFTLSVERVASIPRLPSGKMQLISNLATPA